MYFLRGARLRGEDAHKMASTKEEAPAFALAAHRKYIKRVSEDSAAYEYAVSEHLRMSGICNANPPTHPPPLARPAPAVGAAPTMCSHGHCTNACGSRCACVWPYLLVAPPSHTCACVRRAVSCQTGRRRR